MNRFMHNNTPLNNADDIKLLALASGLFEIPLRQQEVLNMHLKGEAEKNYKKKF